jgi:NADP-dependent 3-hydroxy acid dehydrogenase YdfG
VKTAIVTGASKGIGKAIVKYLTSDGWTVIAIARNIEKIKELNNENIRPYQLDVTDLNAVNNFIKYISDTKIDLLVNNAGNNFEHANIQDSDPIKWKESYNLNVIAPMHLSKSVIPNMLKNNDGRIIIITSIVGHEFYEGGGNYTTAKHAAVALIKQLQLELDRSAIKITEIAPGMVNSNESNKINRALEVDHIAEAVRWVASLPSTVSIDSMIITSKNKEMLKNADIRI